MAINMSVLVILVLNIIKCVEAYLPAMVANATPVIIGKLIRRRHPIDFNKNFVDGRPILGPGKTWEGLLGGLLAGSLVGALISSSLSYPTLVTASLFVPLGALLGDIAGSFLKRRLGIKRGDPLPIADQLDFYIGATIALYVKGEMPHLLAVVVFAVLVYYLHKATNELAYALRLKNVPW